MTDCGFVGLGRMGGAMARRLIESGHGVVVYDVSEAACRELGEVGATVVANAKAVGDASTVVFLSLPSPAIAIETVLGTAGVRQGARVEVCVDLSTSGPEAAIRIERLWDYPGLGTPSSAAVVNFVKGLTGANGTIKVAFGTEGGLFDARLGIATVICGPGSMAQGHKPDEYVSVEQLARCEAMMAALLVRLETGF